MSRLVLRLLACILCLVSPSALAQELTWRGQIAPILYRNCASCHHPGGSAPFSLITFADAQRWGRQIETVTSTRYMPPWLPEPGHLKLADARRLSSEDLSRIATWVHASMPEGGGPAPVPPTFPSEWQLGPPDLILEMPAAFHVPADGPDLFENFILPANLPHTALVRAMEIKPGTPAVIHHANVLIDRTASIRRAHPADWQTGIPGMDILVDSGDRFDPDSHFLFWKPDSTALVEPPTMPWRLDPDNDLVLNMHFKPTGKPETVRARIGLYFTPQPATQHPMLLQLEADAALDIPAGDHAFPVHDELKLPVAVDLLGIYPHAHYLAARMEAWATLPNGTRRDLITIPHWDIDRQSVYRLAEPLTLPAGTVLHMRYLYDNSVANPHNPHSPPIRVRAGNRSEDEMAHLWLQVLPHPTAADPDPRVALERAWMQHRLASSPHDSLAAYNLASLELEAGHGTQAATVYRQLLAQTPADPRLLTSLGSALLVSGDPAAARDQFSAALHHDATYTDAAFDLASLDLNTGDPAHAESLFRTLITQHPDDPEAHDGLASALLALNRASEAQSQFASALRLDPTDSKALNGLGSLALEGDDFPRAQSLLTQSLAAHPQPAQAADAEHLLAAAYAAQNLLVKALEHLQAWQHLAPADPDPHRALSQTLGQMGRLPEAIAEQKKALALAQGNAGDWNDLAVLEAETGDKLNARKHFEQALKLDPGNQPALANLRKL